MSTDVTSVDKLYNVTAAGVLPGVPKPLIEFNITAEHRQPAEPLSPGTNGELRFEFRLLRDKIAALYGLSSNTADDLTKQFTVEATIDIWYHGNSNPFKRSLVADGPLPSVSHTQISFYDMGDAETDLAENNNNAVDEEPLSLSLFASSAPTVAVSAAAVAVFGAALLA